MTYREFVVQGRIQSEHAVQLFDSPESLAETVAGILASPATTGRSAASARRTRGSTPLPLIRWRHGS